MIVKIKTTKVDDPGTQNAWVYFDGFRKVKIVRTTTKHLQLINPDIDYVVIDEKNNLVGCLIICSKRDNGNEYLIATTEESYLLNDEGKTIERLF